MSGGLASCFGSVRKSWSSVALSSAEAEIHAIVKAGREDLGLRELLPQGTGPACRNQVGRLRGGRRLVPQMAGGREASPDPGLMGSGVPSRRDFMLLTVPHSQNPSDVPTHRVSVSEFDRAVHPLGFALAYSDVTRSL